MRFFRKTILMALALIAMFLVGSAVANDENTSVEPVVITESRVLTQSDIAYQEMSRTLKGAKLIGPIISAIHYPEGWDWHQDGSLMKRQMDWQRSKRGDALPKYTITPEPNPPTTTPPHGTESSSTETCSIFRYGPAFDDVHHGTATYHWEYGYRVDSDGDGKKDSDPGWFLTKSEFSVYQQTSAGEILC